MSTRSMTPARRAATTIALAGAGLAIAGSGSAWAATPITPVPCGTAAHPALYTTVHHDAVPAVTHDVTVIDQARVPGVDAVPEASHVESTVVNGEGSPVGAGWQPSGRTETVEDSPAYTEYEWVRKVVDRAGVPGSPAVAAVTHEETVVDSPAWDEKVVDSPAAPAVEEVSHYVTVVDKAAWDEKVVDSPGVPAVEEVSHYVTVVDKAAWDETVVDGYAYVQKQTGKVRYESSPSWNVEGDKDLGWSRAPEQDRTRVVHHAAVTHQEKVVDVPASPAVPEVSHIVHHPAQTHEEKVVDVAASPAVAEVSHIVHHPAVTRQVTVVDAPEVPAVEAVEELSHTETAWTRDTDTSPEGDGWALTGEQRVHEAVTHLRHEWTRTVVDSSAVEAVPEVPEVSHTETVVDVPAVPAWDEQVLVTAATPAGSPCAPRPTAVGDATLDAAVSPSAQASTHPAALPAQTLAHTGDDLAVPLGAGLVLVVVGGVLVAAGRRRSA